MLPDGRVFARAVRFHGRTEVFADETAWLKAVESYWRKETGGAVLKAV